MPVPHNAEYEPSAASCSKKSRCKSGTSTQVSSTALNIYAVCQALARIHHSARVAGLLQRLRNFFRVFAHVREFLRGLRDELSAAGVEEIAIFQHVSQPKFPAAPAWDGRRQFAVLNKPHNRWSTE